MQIKRPFWIKIQKGLLFNKQEIFLFYLFFKTKSACASAFSKEIIFFRPHNRFFWRLWSIFSREQLLKSILSVFIRRRLVRKIRRAVVGAVHGHYRHLCIR